MRLLLDTNIVIMLIADESRLPRSYLALLGGPASLLFVSTVSLWEIAIKQRKGKLNLGFSLDEIEDRLARVRVSVLALAANHAIADASLPDVLKDPFDRLIAAVAEVENLTLLTTDTKLLDHPLAWRP